MENTSELMKEHREDSKAQIEALKEYVTSAKGSASNTKKKGSVLQVKPEIKWPKLGDYGPGGKENEIF